MKLNFNFRTLAISFFIALLPFAANCQGGDKGSLQYLLASNGFGQIKLGADLKALEAGKLAYLDDVDSLDEDSCYKFSYKDQKILHLGNGLDLNLVGFRTYKNKIVNIYLFFPRAYGYTILAKFEATYGKFTNASGSFIYDWKTSGVTLSLRYNPNVEMGVAIFTCNNIDKQLAADDNQRKTRQAQQKNLLGSL